MRPTSPLPDEAAIIDYTLSLAAVKTGYLDAMALSPIISEETNGYEVEGRHEIELDRTEYENREERNQEENREDLTSEATTVEDELEVDEQGTIASSMYADTQQSFSSKPSTWESIAVSHKIKTAKKKLTRFVKKTRKKRSPTTDQSLSTKSRSRSFPFLASFSAGAASTGAPTPNRYPSYDQDTVQKKSVNTNEAIVKEETKQEKLPPLLEPPPPPPPLPQPLPESPERRVKKGSPSQRVDENSSTPSSTARKLPDDAEKTNEGPVSASVDEDSLQDPAAKKTLSASVEESFSRETVSENSSKDDKERTSNEKKFEFSKIVVSQSSESSLDDVFSDRTGNSFTVSQVNKRTFIINESGSAVDDSWSRDEHVEGGCCTFGCGMCCCGAPKEEWDDDESIQSDSEEGRVADAVITIQEHANRLGLTEYELLQMIQDE